MYFIFNFKLLSIFKDFKNKNCLSIVNFYGVPLFYSKGISLSYESHLL